MSATPFCTRARIGRLLAWLFFAATVIPMQADVVLGGIPRDAVRIYVSNEGSGDVAVIDPGRRTVAATIPVGPRPRGMTCDATGKLYVAISGSPMPNPVPSAPDPPADRTADGVAVVDPDHMEAASVLHAGPDPSQVALTQDGKCVVVAGTGKPEVRVVELTSGKGVRTIVVGAGPAALRTNPVSGEIWVVCQGDNTVRVMDAAATRVVAQLTVSSRPSAVAFSKDGLKAFVTAEGSAALAVVDAKGHHVLQSITVPGELMLPAGVAPAADGKLVFVATDRGNQVAVIDLATAAVRQMITVGQRPRGIAQDPAGKYLYVANTGSDDVSVIDVATLAEVDRIKVGKAPRDVVVGAGRK